jgi:xanthine dehydrogenase YagS FAD-binding subunit
MNPFSYVRPEALNAALESFSDNSRFIAGGTNLLDLMKENVERPAQLIDLNRLPLRGISETESGGLLLGALERNADTAWNPMVEDRYPLLSKAILAGASPQLRNMATNGGNLLQRTRCYYFYDTATACNKREPGSGCSALKGFNRIHAIVGTSDQCIATHPSDMCVALAALDAVVIVQGQAGGRRIAFDDFHRLPDDRPQIDTNLRPAEIITGIELPAEGFAQHHAYLKIRDRASYAFALVSVAAALRIDNGIVREARLAMGGVAHRPWRSRAVEAFIVNKAASKDNFRKAAELLLKDAKGYGHNDFKIELGKRAVVRALELAVEMPERKTANP